MCTALIIHLYIPTLSRARVRASTGPLKIDRFCTCPINSLQKFLVGPPWSMDLSHLPSSSMKTTYNFDCRPKVGILKACSAHVHFSLQIMFIWFAVGAGAFIFDLRCIKVTAVSTLVGLHKTCKFIKCMKKTKHFADMLHDRFLDTAGSPFKDIWVSHVSPQIPGTL